jgi:N-acetylmuramic acid 6-phosphate etherase
VQAGNAKLVERSEAMLMRLTDRSREEAREALRRAGGSVKLAVLLLQGCDVDEATTLLERAGGQLRGALCLVGQPSSDA